MHQSGRNLVLAILAMFLLALPLRAQSFYGSIVGAVTDSTGAVVPGATVTITNIGTNDKHTAQSNASGEFSFVSLVPASYKVEVSKASFKRWNDNFLSASCGAFIMRNYFSKLIRCNTRFFKVLNSLFCIT